MLRFLAFVGFGTLGYNIIVYGPPELVTVGIVIVVFLACYDGDEEEVVNGDS